MGRAQEQVEAWDVVLGWAGGGWVEAARERVPAAIVFAPIAERGCHTKRERHATI